jgi:hypothetical protein
MLQTVRLFLLIEAITFFIAALIHSGMLVTGYEHWQARTAESVIAAVLFIGLIVSLARPVWTRTAGLYAQGFALLGTLVGIFTIIVGVGPRTAPDVIYHICIVIVLVWGITVAARGQTDGSVSST